MNQRTQTPTLVRKAAGALLALAALCLTPAPAAAQSTSGGTQINNQASASYSDGSTTYNAKSNIVTVTVANVSGLVITPDNGSIPTAVAGETDVDFSFTVTNSGNYATQVRFPAGGGAISTTGPATVTGARIDVDGDGFDTDEDVDVLGNGAPVLYPSAAPWLARNASFNVIVRVSVNAAAAPGTSFGVTLGDAAADNEAAEGSNTEVRTSVPPATNAPANGESEAVGNASTTVENDARLQVELDVPAGPVALGSNITYSVAVRNTGARDVKTQTLQNVTGGPATGVFVVVPVPVGTTLQSVPAPPAGVTVLYSTSALGSDPGPGDPPASGPVSNAVAWTYAPPAVLSSTTRVAFRLNNGGVLAAAAFVENLDLVLTVSSGINASTPVYGVAEAFGRNSVNAPITDQNDHPSSQIANQGDGNANFNEPRHNTTDAVTATQGLRLPTLLTQVGDVLLGPSGAPGAAGPGGDNNLDYTNRSVAPAAIDGLSHLDQLSGQVSVLFTNTVQNTGNADDTYTFTAPSFPLGFGVEISTDGGTNFVPASSNPTLAVAFGATANIVVRVTTTPTAAVLQGFSTTIRATSANTPAETNDTINRVYTGFLKLEKTSTIVNPTDVGNGQDDPGPDDAVPGAHIQYVITYTNISVGGGGAGCVDLVASSVVIRERGDSAPNNWDVTTKQVTDPMPSDANSTGTPGTVTDELTGQPVTEDTVRLQDAVPNLGPQATGTFTFRRRIN
ncbi:MAG TPA: hypothetical protein VG148_15120 [Pyrinomonadaceae bacterium]|nr:hypothetical protein [Pyrinomonadaceae bacterium]